jgi:pyruvate dehydrogenase (quinone)
MAEMAAEAPGERLMASPRALAFENPAIDVSVNPDELPMPGKAGHEQSRDLAKAFRFGEPSRATIWPRLFRDTIAELQR